MFFQDINKIIPIINDSTPKNYFKVTFFFINKLSYINDVNIVVLFANIGATVIPNINNFTCFSQQKII